MAVIEQLVSQYGYLTVAVGVGAESIGVPLPGETILITAAAYAGATGNLSPGIVVLVAATAAIVGDNIGYVLGRRLGPPLLATGDRPSAGRVARGLRTVRGLFEHYGVWVVVLGRFVSVVRTYAAFGAGATGMRWRRFLILNATGGVGWAGLVGFGSAALGASVGSTATYALLALAVVGFLVGALWLRRPGRHGKPAAGPAPGPDPARLRPVA